MLDQIGTDESLNMRTPTVDQGKSKTVVLVTGASGYVALHCVNELLHTGYTVRGTVRSIKNEQKVAPLKRLPFANERLELVEADLMKPEDWPRVIEGCTYILHVASPWPIVADEGTVRTAVEGTMTVLKAAANVPTIKKVVLTSSCAAINDGHDSKGKVFDETYWSDLDNPKVEYYARSKTLAERAAWEFWRSLEESKRFDFTVLHPTFITGPVLSDVENGSCTIIGRMMHIKTYLAAPKASIGVVDVRDVARAQVQALSCKQSNGERILITNTSAWFADITRWLFREFRMLGYPITLITSPTFILKLYQKTGIDPMVDAVMHRVGPEVLFDNSKSKNLLNMTYIDAKQSVLDMMHSMIEHEMVKQTRGYKKMMQKKAANVEKLTQTAHSA